MVKSRFEVKSASLRLQAGGCAKPQASAAQEAGVRAGGRHRRETPAGSAHRPWPTELVPLHCLRVHITALRAGRCLGIAADTSSPSPVSFWVLVS